MARQAFIVAQVLWHFGAPSLPAEGHLEFRVSGVNIPRRESLDWPLPPLSLGDEITIRIVKTDQPDSGISGPLRDPEKCSAAGRLFRFASGTFAARAACSKSLPPALAEIAMVEVAAE